MGQTIFLSDNLMNVRMYPLHVVSAEEEPAGYEAFRVASARRDGTSYATATTANSDWWVKVVCDRLRSASLLVLDRGHNLDGEAVQLQVSGDDTNWTTIVSVTAVPSSPGGDLDATIGTAGVYGTVTEEGAYVVRFPAQAAYYWRLLIPAMGADLKPQLPGVWLGLAFQAQCLMRPVARGHHQLLGASGEVDSGWTGFGRRVARREGMLHLNFNTPWEGELARLHLEGRYGQGRPTWLIWDEDVPEDALCIVPPPSAGIGLQQEARWFYPRADLPYQEHEGLIDG